MKYIALILSLFAQAALTANAAAAQAPVTVTTATVTSEFSVARMPVTGIVLSRQDAAIAAELSGRLTWIADVGDQVQAGDLLASLDPHLFQLEQRNRQAEVRRLQANLEWRSRQTKRLEELATRNNTAHSELDEIRSRHAMMQQELDQAQVAVERASYDLERAGIRAPFNGIVVSREVSAGEYTAAGSSLLRLVNTAAAEISVTAPLQLARYIRAGDGVAVGDQGTRGNATVRSMIAVGDSRSHMMELRITPDIAANWLIGEAVSVSLPASAAGQLTTVPRDALILRDHSNYVYVVEADNTARRVTVDLGSGLGERIAVSGKLSAGDEVVTRGAERLRDGQLVARLDQALSMR